MTSKTEDILTMVGAIVLILGVCLISEWRVPETDDFLKQENAVIEEIPTAPELVVDEWKSFFFALREVEGDSSDNPLQITPAFWEEGCKFGGLGYKYVWRANYDVSCMVSKAYLEHYAPRAYEQKDWFILACVFRKGPAGQGNATAKEYAGRVVNLIESWKGTQK